MCLWRGWRVVTGTAWRVLLAAADTSSGGLKGPCSPVLHGFARLAKPGTERQTQAEVAGGPDFDPDFAEVPGLIEPYLSATPCMSGDSPMTLPDIQHRFGLWNWLPRQEREWHSWQKRAGKGLRPGLELWLYPPCLNRR